MRYEIREKLYSDPINIKYIRENSVWYKKLNRGTPIEEMINEMKERYGMRFKDKIDKIGTGMDLINAFMNVTKD